MVNRRVRNATKCEADGFKFDSKLEMYAYRQFKEAGFDFDMQVEIELVPKFRYNGEAVRAIKIIPDFYLKDHNTYVDTKGFALPEAKLKYKLLKYLLYCEYGTELQPKVVILKNQKEVREYVQSLIS